MDPSSTADHPTRRALHAAILIAAVLPWALGCLILWLGMMLTVLAYRLLPGATWGNCWSYAVPRWLRHGGYLAIRWSDDIALAGRWRIPHAIWLPRLNNACVRMTYPRKRRAGRWFPIHVALFPFEVRDADRRDVSFLDTVPAQDTDWVYP